MIAHVVVVVEAVAEITAVETTVEAAAEITAEVVEAAPIIIKTSPLRVEAHLDLPLLNPALILKPIFRRTELCL
ncbi:MAG: hypothetical protein ACJAQT_000285 [Akkermansiaceae bacterium]|jgi:hypothetical protein